MTEKINTEELNQEWLTLMNKLEAHIGKKPKDMNAVLFLIGVQELGKGVRNFSKEEKQDLMHIAVCKLLSQEGYYRFVEKDKDGWPHYELNKTTDTKNLLEQVAWLKKLILMYFSEL